MTVGVELALIGALVIDPEALERVVEIVQPNDFTQPALREVYRCMLALRDAKSRLDYVTLCEEIEWSGRLDSFAPTPNRRASIVTRTINYAPTSLHVMDYARLVGRQRRAMAAPQDDRPERVPLETILVLDDE